MIIIFGQSAVRIARVGRSLIKPMTLIDLANPSKFLSPTARVLPWLVGLTAILLAIGLYQSATAPDDYQQGATVKILFIHVPNTWLSMFVWGVMSLAALGTLVWRHPLADVAAKAAPRSAPPSRSSRW